MKESLTEALESGPWKGFREGFLFVRKISFLSFSNLSLNPKTAIPIHPLTREGSPLRNHARMGYTFLVEFQRVNRTLRRKV